MPTVMCGQLRPLKFSSTVWAYCSWVARRLALERLQPERGVYAHRDRVRTLGAALQEGGIRGSAAGNRGVARGHVQRDRGGDVLARDRRLQDAVGVIDHGLRDPGQPGAGGPEAGVRGQGLLGEVESGGRLADGERLDAGVRDVRGCGRGASGALGHDRRSVRDGGQSGHGGGHVGVAGLRHRHPQARLDVQACVQVGRRRSAAGRSGRTC